LRGDYLKLTQEESQILIKALSGFEIGQTVFWRKENPQVKKCEACSGTHLLTAIIEKQPSTIPCPYCNSRGEVGTTSVYSAEMDTIRSAYLTISNIHPNRANGDIDIQILEPIFYLMDRPFEIRGNELYDSPKKAIDGRQ
jgi:DNA-directed RNA polymerase subunit RPC12/RpoP